MGTFINIAQFITSLGLLILLHEFGHFITARMFKIRVDKFYMFFDFLFPLPGVLNFALFKKKVGDTEYGIGWFPMGGYVQIAGMIDESLDTEQMNKPAEPWEFRAHPAWQRLIVMLGGIIVNVLLAFLIYAMILFTWGEKKTPMSSLKDGIACNDSIGKLVGFQTGDKIISVDNKPIHYFNDLKIEILLGHTVQIDRNGEKVEIKLPQDFVDQIATNEKFFFIDIRRPAFFQFSPESVNKNVDIKANDRIIGINDSIKITYYDEFQTQLKQFKNQSVVLNVERNNQIIKVPVQVNQNSMVGAVLVDVPEEDLEKMAKNMAINQSAKEKKIAEFQQKAAAFQELVQRSQAEMQGREAELTRPIIEGLRNLVPEVAKAKKMDLVFEANSVGPTGVASNPLLYAEDKIDLTNDVIKTFDEKK